MSLNIGIVGGGGHVGIPLGLAFASKGFDVTLIDINQNVITQINQGIMPFVEEGAEPILKACLHKNLRITSDMKVVSQVNVVFFVTGTPVDEHHCPKINEVMKVINLYLPYLNQKQLIILRSTIYPGTVELIHHKIEKKWGHPPLLAFCPERIVQGKGIEEIFSLPQLVSATSPTAEDAAVKLFNVVTPKTIRLKPKEAELAKLITNSWRYVQFAIANQFYMMTEEMGLDFYTIFNALSEDYPRAKHYAKPGLAAGPCLFKDTMQLSSFYENQYFLGQAAMLVNEGLPAFLVRQLEEKIGNLKNKRVAILGMAFKANVDDTRESLSFKVKKILKFKMAEVITHDPYLEGSPTLQKAIDEADALILGVPHKEYLNLAPTKLFVDCWGVWRK